MLNNLVAQLGTAGGGAGGSSYESISTVTLGANATSITFSSIPSTYKHLQLRGQLRPNGSLTTLSLTCNGASTNYRTHYLEGDGSAVYAGSLATSYLLGAQNGTGTTYFGAHIIDLIDYASTSKTKTIRFFGGWDANGSGDIQLLSGLYNSTSAITTLTLGVDNGSNINTGSTFALYGIKG